MLFCLGDSSDTQQGEGYQKSYRAFNQQLTKKEWENVKSELPEIKLPLNTWVDKDNMTADEKKNNSVYKEIGGFLRTLSYKESWAKWWSEAKQADKNKILDCKYFDQKIFEGITGIKDTKKINLSGKTVKVTVDGQEFEAVIK